MSDLRELVTLFETDGSEEYFGEEITQARHMLQAAAAAEGAGADDALVAAALLHDVGHFHGALRGHDLVAGTDNHHAEVGARWLARWFGPEVTKPIRLHVLAKRYLCAVEPAYIATLSVASIDSLRIQGGPLTASDAEAFGASSGATAAVAVRRWDDAAKDPARTVPPLGHYLALLDRLAGSGGRRAPA